MPSARQVLVLTWQWKAAQLSRVMEDELLCALVWWGVGMVSVGTRFHQH